MILLANFFGADLKQEILDYEKKYCKRVFHRCLLSRKRTDS